MDYAAIHIHLAYALEGINYAALKTDPYTLENDVPLNIPDNVPDKIDHIRKLNKKILLTALNAKGDHPTASSVYNELWEDGKLRKYGITSYEPIRDKLKLLKLMHKPIEGYIADNQGIYLQYFDSLVIEQLISHFTSRRIPILTIHDSVICKEEHQSIVKDKMLELFANMINNQLRKYVLQKHSNNPNVKIIHIKYQRSITKPQWHILPYKVPGYVPPKINIRNELSSNLIFTQSMINYFLKIDDLIEIVPDDIRTNKCTCRCNTYKRYQYFLSTRKLYRGNIKIKLIRCERDYIKWYNGH